MEGVEDTLPRDLLHEAWRLKEFGRMGFSFDDILLLKDANVAMHEAEDLISAGCPPEVAVQILT